MTATFSLRPGFTSGQCGAITYGTYSSSFDVGAALVAGGGTIVTNLADLAYALSQYGAVFKSADDGAPLVPGVSPRWGAISLGASVATGATALEVRRSGEAQARLLINGDGTIYQGNGTVAPTLFAGGGSGHTIQDEGTPLTARPGLNFIGGGVAATDDAGNNRTNVTISAAVTNEAPLNVLNHGVVGDGSDETTAIQTLVTAAGGGTLYFPHTTAGYAFTNLTLVNNVRMMGDGRNRTKLLTLGPAAPGTTILNGNGKTNIQIEDLTLDGGGQTNAAIGIYINGSNTAKLSQVARCRIQNFTSLTGLSPFGSAAQGVYCWTADHVRIEDNEFIDNIIDVVMDQPGTDCQVIDNQMWSSNPATVTSRQYGVVMRKSSAAAGGGLVRGNTIRDVLSDPSAVGTQGHAIQLNNVWDVRVEGNTCDNFQVSAVHVGSGSQGAEVIGNTMTNGVTNTAIYCEQNFGSTVLGTTGARVGCLLLGNTIRTVGGYGISLSYAPATRVIGNSIEGAQREGIFCDSDRCTIAQNHVWNCYLGNAAANPGSTPNVKASIRVTTGNRCNVTDNHVYTTNAASVADYAIAVSDANHIVRDNRCETGFVTDSIFQPSTATTNRMANNTPAATGVPLIPAVASATALTLPAAAQSPGTDLVSVTGTTTVTSVTATGFTGQIITLLFAGILTMTDGSNLKLVGNFVTAAGSSLTLACDGTNWTEIARATP